jgi:hypothetical protein
MMRAVLDAGACGFRVEIEVSKLSSRRVSVALTSECEMISQLAEEIKELDWHDALRGGENSVLNKAVSQCIRHIDCPVLVGIIKVIEVEAGVALPKDVTIHFE